MNGMVDRVVTIGNLPSLSLCLALLFGCHEPGLKTAEQPVSLETETRDSPVPDRDPSSSTELDLDNIIPPQAGEEVKPGLFFIASRTFEIGDEVFHIPWYRYFGNYNAISTKAFWQSVPLPDGVRASYVGYYRRLRWCEWINKRTHRLMRAKGVSFINISDYIVPPGPGSVKIRRWLYEETSKQMPARFKDERYYVFALDRPPQERWRNGANEPATDLDPELSHVMGIVEVQPTFDSPMKSKDTVLYLTADNLVRFENMRNYSSSSRMDFSVERISNRFVVRTAKGDRTASPETLEKLFSAINTLEWKAHPRSPHFDAAPVAKTTITYQTSDAVEKTVVIEYRDGAWVLRNHDDKFYTTIHPRLLYEVQKDIELRFR